MARRKEPVEEYQFVYTEEMKQRARARIAERERTENFELIRQQYLEVCLKYVMRRMEEERQKDLSGIEKRTRDEAETAVVFGAPTSIRNAVAKAAISSKLRLSVIGKQRRRSGKQGS